MKPHNINLEPVERPLEIYVGETKLGETEKALSLIEPPLEPVYYVPRDDVGDKYLEPSDHTTTCPFKGEATYFHLKIGQLKIENAVWSYEKPIESVAQIRGMLAFDPEKVQFKIKI